MTEEQLEKGKVLITQIKELEDFARSFAESEFNAPIWPPDFYKEEHDAIMQGYAFDFTNKLNHKIFELKEQFKAL